MPPTDEEIAEWKSRFPCHSTKQMDDYVLCCLLRMDHEDACEFVDGTTERRIGGRRRTDESAWW